MIKKLLSLCFMALFVVGMGILGYMHAFPDKFELCSKTYTLCLNIPLGNKAKRVLSCSWDNAMCVVKNVF